MSTTTTTATTTRDRGDRYGPMEWAQQKVEIDMTSGRCLGYLMTKPTQIVVSCDQASFVEEDQCGIGKCGVLHLGGIQRLHVALSQHLLNFIVYC